MRVGVKISFLILICWLLFVSLAGAQLAPKTKKSGQEEPLEIIADRLDVYNDKRKIVFTGNASASQKDRLITADRITIFYKQDDAPRVSKTSETDKARGAIEKVEADGRVVIKEGLRVVRGEGAIYDPETQKITVWGKAELREGENTVKGEKITVFLEENRGLVEGSQVNRVRATIYSTQHMREAGKDKP